MRQLVLCLGLGLGVRAGVAEAEPPPGVVPHGSGVRLEELARLDGHRVELVEDGYRIVDVAGEGAPLVGVVERRGADLWLRLDRGAARRLEGPLAVPRIAGPGYKVWVIGSAGPDGSLIARRLGVLSPPQRR